MKQQYSNAFIGNRRNDYNCIVHVLTLYDIIRIKCKKKGRNYDDFNRSKCHDILNIKSNTKLADSLLIFKTSVKENFHVYLRHNTDSIEKTVTNKT